jgi:phosphoglycerate kinase
MSPFWPLAHIQGRLYGAIGTKADDEMILDIGSRSIEHVCSVLARVKTLVWNGPFGAFELEPFDIGTVEIAAAAAELTAAGKLVTDGRRR